MLFGKKKQDALPAFDIQDDDNTSSSDDVLGVSWETECAWCLRDQGIIPLTGSHGICEWHRAQVWQEYQAQRRSR